MVSVRDAIPEGRARTLEAMRDALAAHIDMCESSRDLPALTRQLADVMRQLEELAPPVVEEGDPVDEIAKRRAARNSGSASGKARAKRPS